MTMLDRMRRHRWWLKWSLALVCLAFVVFYVPDFLSQQEVVGAAPDAAVAEVNGRKVTVAAFTRAYYQRLDMYRQQAGDQFDPDLLRQLGVDRQILGLLIDEQAMLAEAERYGLRVSDAEVRERIVTLPGLQENGRFIGEQRYRQLLQLQRPPLTPPEFENEVRNELLLDKLRTALTSWIAVSDEDVEHEYRRRHETASIDVVAVARDAFTEEAEPDEDEVAAHFEANQEAYRLGEKRKIRFVAVETQALRDRVEVSSDDAKRYYDEHLDQYSTPAQVQARHVLLRTEERDADEVRADAERLLAEIHGGADFAAIAREHSEDPGSREQGGDLGFFGRGAMVPEFEEVAFALEPGEVSEVVESPFGFHIIQVTDTEEAAVQPFAEVEHQIIDQLRWQEADTRAEQIAQELAGQATDADALEEAARQQDLTVQESDFFKRDGPIEGLGQAPAVSQAAFALGEGQVTDLLRTAQGYVIATLVATEPARVPELAEVEARVRTDLTGQRALELARERARSLTSDLQEDFHAAAKTAGLEVETIEAFRRGQDVPGIGVSARVDTLAFSLPTGGVSDPIDTDTGVAVIHVADRTAIDEEDLEADRETLRLELLNERRARFFNSYLARAKERMQIQQHEAVLQAALPST